MCLSISSICAALANKSNFVVVACSVTGFGVIVGGDFVFERMPIGGDMGLNILTFWGTRMLAAMNSATCVSECDRDSFDVDLCKNIGVGFKHRNKGGDDIDRDRKFLKILH